MPISSTTCPSAPPQVLFESAEDAMASPRPLIKGLLNSLVAQLTRAEIELDIAKKEREVAEETFGKLHHCLGRLAFLRLAATRAAHEARAQLHHQRRSLLGESFGSERSYIKLKEISLAR